MIATAGSDDRVKLALDLGADYGINYNSQDLREEVMKITGGKASTSSTTRRNSKILPRPSGARHERASRHGGRAWPERDDQLLPPLHKKITIMDRTGHGIRHSMLRDGAEGKLKAQSRSCCRSRARPAHQLVEVGRSAGKIVLDPTLDGQADAARILG